MGKGRAVVCALKINQNQMKFMACSFVHRSTEFLPKLLACFHSGSKKEPMVASSSKSVTYPTEHNHFLFLRF